MTDRHELWKLADRLQMDLNNAQARLVELRSHLAQLKLTQPEPKPTPTVCPHCDVAAPHHAADCPETETAA